MRCCQALPDQRAGRHAEDRHDRVAVEVGPDRVQLLLLAQPGDPLLEVVVGRGAAAPPCAGCGWCSRTGSACAAGRAAGRRRRRSGAPPSRSTPRCRSRGTAGAARPAGTRPRRRPSGTAAPSAGPRVSLAPTTSWWWNETPPPGSNRAGLRLADVVHQRGQPQHEVRAVPGPRARWPARAPSACARRRPCAGGARRSPAPARGSSGSTCVGQPGVDQQRQPGPRVRARAAAWSARRGPARRTRSRSGRPSPSSPSTTAGSTAKPSWAANRAARIIRSGSSLNESSGRPGVRSSPAARSSSPPYGSTNVVGRQRDGHRVDGEVAAAQVVLEGVAVGHLGLARVVAVDLGAVRRDLDQVLALARADRAERDADLPAGVGPALEQRRAICSGRASVVEVEVRRRPAEQRVAHRARRPGPARARPRRSARPSSSSTGASSQQLGREPAPRGGAGSGGAAAAGTSGTGGKGTAVRAARARRGLPGPPAGGWLRSTDAPLPVVPTAAPRAGGRAAGPAQGRGDLRRAAWSSTAPAAGRGWR